MNIDIELMKKLLKEARTVAGKVTNWSVVDELSGWKIYSGRFEYWSFIIGVENDGEYADGTATCADMSRSKAPFILHLTPELSKEISKMILKHIEENTN